jgi:hypothetical protein
MGVAGEDVESQVKTKRTINCLTSFSMQWKQDDLSKQEIQMCI